MRKTLAIALLVSLFGFGTASADILPEGQTVVQVCAYFNNTADFLDELTFFYYETAPGGARVDLSQLIADECVKPAYKFNSYGVFAVTVEHAAALDLDTYNPSEDNEAYLTNIPLEVGYMMVDENTTTERIENEYTIIELDMVAGALVIEPVKTTVYKNDGSDPVVTEGEVTQVAFTAEEDVIVEDEVLGNVFTDVDHTSKYYDALIYLKENGVIGGYPDGSYKPDSTINRAEFTKIVMGSVKAQTEIDECLNLVLATSTFMEGWDGVLSLFTDVSHATNSGSEPSWYFNYVCLAQRSNVIGGYPDGSFKPDQEINFVEGAKIITRAVFGEEVGTSEPWYKTYVMVLDDWNAIPSSVTTFDKKLTRGEMAEIMYRLKAEVKTKESLTYSDLT